MRQNGKGYLTGEQFHGALKESGWGIISSDRNALGEIDVHEAPTTPPLGEEPPVLTNKPHPLAYTLEIRPGAMDRPTTPLGRMKEELLFPHPSTIPKVNPT